MVFFRCFECTVFHPMPNTSDKHELIKTILYPIKRIHISAQGWIVGGVLSCESRYALFSSKFRRNEDIDRIIRDLREKHRKDITSAPEVSVAQQMKKDLDEVANFKGSRLEKQMILYCKQLQIDYRKLTEEEFRWFIRILKKSKLYKGGGRGR